MNEQLPLFEAKFLAPSNPPLGWESDEAPEEELPDEPLEEDSDVQLVLL